jgi:O-antigen ligase
VRAAELSAAVLAPESISAIAVWLYGALVVGLVAADAGGYDPVSWGWVGFLSFGIACVALLLRERIAWSRAEIAMLAGLTAFVLWVALSNFWTPSVTSSMHEVQRDLAYLGIAACALALVRKSTASYLLGGVETGIVVISLYALGTRVLPDRLGQFDSNAFGYRLAAPITYWNGLGIFAAVGILLALLFAARARSALLSGLAAAALPLLVVTMYFTFSRGAWLALAVGLVVAVALDPRRLQLTLVALPPAIFSAVALQQAHSHPALTSQGSTLGDATHQGHALVPVLLGLAAVSGVVIVLIRLVERRATLPRWARVAYASLLVATLAAGLAAGFARFGSPEHIAERAWHGFRGAPTQAPSADVSQRLFQLSSDGRLAIWRVAWSSFERKPWTGNGAGTFWQLWQKDRTVGSSVVDAHSLYMQVLAELGWPGLVLICIALLAPLAAAVPARRRRIVAPAAGAYVAFLVHTGIDWDWQLMAVGATGLLIGVALLTNTRDMRSSSQPLRMITAVTCAALALVAGWGLLGERALASGARLAARGDMSSARSELNRAAFFLPWSSEPDEFRANGYAVQGRIVLARRYYQRALSKDSSSWLLWTALASVSRGPGRAQAERMAHELSPFG